MKPSDPTFTRRTGELPWPEWVESFRDHQVTATEQILDAYQRGVDVVFLDAPTGSGKTLVAEAVRRQLGVCGVYVCNGKDLQHQFANDYPYAKVLKGRANYPTEFMPAYTAEDCLGKLCAWCEETESCPYQIARQAAREAPVAVLNTSYFLHETQNEKSKFTGGGLVVADESDTLEGILMGHVEFRITARRMDELGIRGPVKSARVGTVKTWLENDFLDGVKRERKKLAGRPGVTPSVLTVRKRKQLASLVGRAKRVTDTIGGDNGWGDWVRDYDTRSPGDLILKPVKVATVAADRLWPEGQRWLCMSASIISVEEQVESLGVDEAGLTWELVKVPMMFPKENRPVKYVPVGDMSWKTIRQDTEKVIQKIVEIVEDHEGDNVLVHAVNYRLAGDIYDGLRAAQVDTNVYTYHSAHERNDVLERFKKYGGVLVAPSMDRGIDLAGDLCRVVVIAKVPFPSLKDRQIEARMRLPGGQWWYSVAVARTILQMCGRGVRSETDSATTYILDRQFGKWWSGSGKKLLPEWWREALTS